MKPARSILDPTFAYVNAASTDLAKTFARIRREMKREAEAKAAASTKVAQIKPQRGAA